MEKKGQMKLSFGMIFSIILIIVFVVFAFYAIKMFLRTQDNVKIGKFFDDFQRDVDSMWSASKGSDRFTYYLPSKIEKVCFLDDEYENIILRPRDDLRDIGGIIIKHIDTSNIDLGREFCIDNVDGKVKIILKKDYGEDLVRIDR